MLDCVKPLLPWWLPFLASLLGGGIVAAFIAGITQGNLAQKSRKRDRLLSQLTQFYGPIYYYVVQNERLFELINKFDQAYQEEIIDPSWAQDEETHKRVGEMADVTINLKNEYSAEVKVNNEKIKGIMDAHFSECEPADAQIFLTFYEHYVRFKIEFDSEGKLRTPMRVYQHLGNVSFMRPEVIKHIKSRCESKQKEYLALTS